MNNRDRRIKKLISNLCAAGLICSTVHNSKVSAWGSYLKWCDKKTSDAAAEHLRPFIQKGVIPLINSELRKNFKDKYDTLDYRVRDQLSKEIRESVESLIKNKKWRVFIDDAYTKYKSSLGALNENDTKVLTAFKEALDELNPGGSFDSHETLGQPIKAGRFSEIVVELLLINSTYNIETWEQEIQYQLRYQISPLTVGLMGVGAIAGTGYLFMMGRGAWHDYNQRKIAREALEAKRRHQKKVDAEAKEYAEQVDIDPKKINIEKLKTMLENEARDYPYAATEMTQFINTYIGILIAKQEDPLAKCPPIILVGKPGCGKTEWIKRVIKCTFDSIEDTPEETQKPKENKKWQERCILINQDKIDKNSSVSARDQISGTHEEKREDVTVTCYSDSAKANKFGKGIHLKYIDEIEKLLVDVILSIWDTADSGGRAIVLATGNGNPADYIEGTGADFKEAFEDRAIILEIPHPDKSYIESSIKKLINEVNEQNPDKAVIVVSEESMKGLVNACRSMRSVATMKSPILGLQLKATLAGHKTVPIKINPKNPKPERIIIDKSYSESATTT